jgi:hypothetical protein
MPIEVESTLCPKPWITMIFGVEAKGTQLLYPFHAHRNKFTTAVVQGSASRE